MLQGVSRQAAKRNTNIKESLHPEAATVWAIQRPLCYPPGKAVQLSMQTLCMPKKHSVKWLALPSLAAAAVSNGVPGQVQNIAGGEGAGEWSHLSSNRTHAGQPDPDMGRCGTREGRHAVTARPPA